MQVKVYRGTKEIGGTCVEITSARGKRLWLDLGAPLSDKHPDVSYAKNPVDALLISHPHQDHYGLMEEIKPNTPVFMGQVSRDLINATRIFLKKPLLASNITTFSPWKWITVADDFKVKPYLVDHSSPEAFAFLIEADGKRVFYSGDFRSTGKKRILFVNMVERPPKKIDLMLCEGTMVGRNNAKYPTEVDVEKAITDIIGDQHNVSFVISSAQNIDRFCSVFSACRKGHKTIVIDVYNAWVLEMVGQLSPGLPKVGANQIKVYLHPNQQKAIQSEEFTVFRKKIEANDIHTEIFSNPSQYVYFVRNPNEKLVEKIKKIKPTGKVNIIYSMWEGYLTEEHKTYATDNINRLKNDPSISFNPIHTSGHATMEDIETLARSISPKMLVPIHTEQPEEFKRVMERDGFNNVCLWDDNKEYQI
jgi:ribonuclease J